MRRKLSYARPWLRAGIFSGYRRRHLMTASLDRRAEIRELNKLVRLFSLRNQSQDFLKIYVYAQWRRKQLRSATPWRAREARAYNGGLGAEPPAGSMGRAPGGGSGGRSPAEAENILAFGRQMEAANLPLFSVIFD